MNKKLLVLLFVISSLFTYFLYQNNVYNRSKTTYSSEDQVISSLKTRLVGKSFRSLNWNYNTLTKSADFFVIYIPSETCYSCLRNLIETFNEYNSQEYVYITAKNPNPSVVGLIKFYNLFPKVLPEEENFVLRILLSNKVLNKPVVLYIKNSIVIDIKIVFDKESFKK
ncbi:MAG: hypothetical protein FD143_2795 [Ignavibacteria bacterium]|nr:MAG: hypothetical protein FD143_2795 [Ignavibacteria bacterium]KAF0158298.1 MAG: hypothetical protein FD188_2556 [Ignavibacteria bacterium]